MITFDPGFKGPAADRTTGMAYFKKFIQTGPADRKSGPFRIHTLFLQEHPANGAHRGINKVDELIEYVHGEKALLMGVNRLRLPVIDGQLWRPRNTGDRIGLL